MATFAAGCFWGVEETFRNLSGVSNTSVGYTGGIAENPTYEQVCQGDSGHAEAVQVKFDPLIISYEELLTVFWNCHNPTSLNQQGPDMGSQYRSVIFFHTQEQENTAIQSRETLQQSNQYHSNIVTVILPASVFYRAEEYHQRYLEKRGER